MFRYDRLEALIEESGKTKVSLCGKIKKCPTYLRDAKKQNTDIKGKTLEILAFELNTTPEYLSGKTDIKSPPLLQGELSPLKQEAWNLVQSMDNKTLEKFIKIAKTVLEG